MGLESFNTDRNYNGGGTTPDYSRQELIGELKRFKQENGKVTRKLFDESDDFPSSGPIRREFGSWNKGLEAAIGEVNINMPSNDSIPSWRAYKYLLDGVVKYGEGITCKQFRKDEKLCSRNTIEDSTGKKFNEIKRHLDITPNQEKDISRERIVNELNSIDGPIGLTDVKEQCTFSPKVVYNYGDGSFSKGIDVLGFNTKGERKMESEYSEWTRKKLNEFNSYAENDICSYIYVLRITTYSDGVWFYVGKVNKSSSIHRRITSHIRSGGDFTKDLDTKEMNLHQLHKVNDAKDLNDEERRISYKVAIDKDTTNVIGGK